MGVGRNYEEVEELREMEDKKKTGKEEGKKREEKETGMEEGEGKKRFALLWLFPKQ